MDTVVMTSPKGERNSEQDIHHLFRAIRKGKAHLTRFMLAASNNSLLNCWNVEGRTPLIECCYIKEEQTRVQMMQILKDAGVDVNMKDISGRTALIHACQQKCNDIVRILIQHAKICPDVEDIDGNTALIHSATIGNDVALELIVKSFRRLGLNVDHFNKAGFTALHVATTSGFLQCAKVLAINGKASLTLKDKVHQMTPLEWCLNEGYPKSEVEFLKPSAKFYRLAKLTTTMAKCRRKSTLDTLPSSEIISHCIPPTIPVEIQQSEVRGLSVNIKSQYMDQDDLDAMDVVGSSNYRKCSDNGANETKSKLMTMKMSKSNIFENSSQANILDKPTTQRRFSQTEGQENSPTATVGMNVILHSRSTLTSTNDLEINALSQVISTTQVSERKTHQECITLPDHFGECDTDDLDTYCSDSKLSVFVPIVSQKTASSHKVSFVEKSNKDTCTVQNDTGQQHCKYGASVTYCYSSPLHYAYPQYKYLSCPSTPSIGGSKDVSLIENVPTDACGVVKNEEPSLCYEDKDEVYTSICAEETLISLDGAISSYQQEPQQLTPMVKFLDEATTCSTNGDTDEEEQIECIQSSEILSNMITCYESPITKIEFNDGNTNKLEWFNNKNNNSDGNLSNNALMKISTCTISTETRNVLTRQEIKNKPSVDISDRNIDFPDKHIPYVECDKFLNSSWVSPQLSNSSPTPKVNGSEQTMTFSTADTSTTISEEEPN